LYNYKKRSGKKKPERRYAMSCGSCGTRKKAKKKGKKKK